MLKSDFKLKVCYIYVYTEEQVDFQVRDKSGAMILLKHQVSLNPLNGLPFARKSFPMVNTKPSIDLSVNHPVISGLRSFDLLFVPVKLWCITNFFSNRSFTL